MAINKSYLNYLIFQILQLLFTSIIYTSVNPWSTDSLLLFEIIFLYLFCQSAYINTKIYHTWKNIDNIFLCFFMFFCGTRVVFDIFSDQYPIENFPFYFNRNFSLNIITRTLYNFCIAILSFNIGTLIWKIFHKFKSNNDSISIVDNSVIPKNIIYTLLFFGILAKLYISFQTFNAIRSLGYHALFLGELTINTNIIIELLSRLYLFAIFYLISTEKKISYFIYVTFFLYVVLSLATGQRGPALLTLVLTVFYLYKLGHLALNPKYLLIVFAFLVFISVGVDLLRREGDMGDGFIKTFLGFFHGQSFSLSVTSATIDYIDSISYSFKDIFGELKFLFHNYWYKFGFNPFENIDSLTLTGTYYKRYSHYISYIVNPNLFYEGSGIGGSYTAQFYAVGKEPLQAIGGVFIGYLFSSIYCLLHTKNILIRFWAYIILILYIYLPRTNILDPFTMNWLSFISSLFIYLFYKFKRIN